jgi:hypothetical protein
MKENFQEALDMVDRDGKLRKTIWGQFWSSHQRFFKYLCMACKVPHVVELSKKALANNKCVVIGLQSTGEARTLEQLDECGGTSGEMSDFVSTARGVLQNLVDKYFPLIDHQTGAIKMNQQKSESINTYATANSAANNTAGVSEGTGAKGGKKSKNSQHVTNILQRLSSYASNKNDNKRPRRTSSVSTSSSNSDNLDDDNNNKSDLDNDDADSFSFSGSEFEDEDGFFDSSEEKFMSDLSSGTEEATTTSNMSSTAALVNDSKSSTFSQKKSAVSPLKKCQNDSGLSLDFKPNVDATSAINDDSDDSDSLFSITKSVSVQLLAEKNNLMISRRKKLRHLAKKRAAAAEKKSLNDEMNNNDDMDLNGTTATNFFYTSDESDDEFKLPTKRLKSSKTHGQSLVKKEELVEDLFR